MSRNTMLTAVVPPSRGNPMHMEHTDETAMTLFGADGVCTEIHTPPDALRRIHEAMHARHTEKKHRVKDVPETVAQIVEDCRLHLNHWPWPNCPRCITPPVIDREVSAFVAESLNRLQGSIAAGKIKAHEWPIFADSIRAAAVIYGMHGYGGQARQLRLLPSALQNFAEKCLGTLQSNKRGASKEVAHAIAELFFPSGPPSDDPGERSEEKSKPKTYNAKSGVSMEIIELPLTERCKAEEDGLRIASSGARIHRPALRRPVLSPRMFVRKSYEEPAGTILVDASGSMGNIDLIFKLMQREPMATIAYYAGAGRTHGWLYVYAKNGWRAAEPVKPCSSGNTVDGPALDWLMAQDAPRTIITDRGFCGAPDSDLQIVRLAMLEAAGDVTVRDYKDGFVTSE